MTEREREIFDLLLVDPLISQNELSDKLGITSSSVAVHISNLIKKGFIKGKGYVLSSLNQGVVVVGGSNIDITGFSNNLMIDRDSNPGVVDTSLGGVGRNIAENLGRLGLDVKLISIVGNDPYGDRIIDEGKKAGMDMSLVSRSRVNQTSVYLQILDDHRDLKVAISDMKIVEEITVEHLKSLSNHLNGAKVIVADGNLSKDVITYLVEYYGSKVFFDTVSVAKSYKIKELIGKIHTIKPNQKEVEKLLDFKIETEEDIETALYLFKEKGLQTPIVSLGEKGVAYLYENKVSYRPPYFGELKSTTGAGDAFMAGLVYSYIKEYPMDRSIKTATALSFLTVASEMAVNPTISQEKLEDRVEAL